MKAVSIHAFGGPEVVTYEDILPPVPKNAPRPCPLLRGRGWKKERW